MAGVKPKRFADMETPFGGQYEIKPLDTILGKELEVLDAEVRDGQFGQFVYIKAKEVGKEEVFVTRTGGQVVIKKVMAAKEKGYLPMLGVIEKPSRYYDIT